MRKELFDTMSATRYLSEKMGAIRLKILYGGEISKSNMDREIERMKLDRLEIHLEKQKLDDGYLRIPTSGEEALFYCRPSSDTEELPKGEYRNSKVVFEYDQDDEPDKISSELQEKVTALKRCVEDINKDIENFNNQLAAAAEEAMREKMESEERTSRREKTNKSIVLPS